MKIDKYRNKDDINMSNKASNVSHRMTISFRPKIFKKIDKLKAKTKVKSFSKEINYLLDDYFTNHPMPDTQDRKAIILLTAQLTEKISQLNKKISGACNNINQIAYNLNLKKYDGQKIDTNKFIMLKGLSLTKDVQALNQNNLITKDLDKEAKIIWRLLR